MMAESRYEELERRVTTAESEIEGEKLVSRYAVEQSTRSTEAFLGLRSEVAALRTDIAVATARIDHLGGEAAATRAALVRHGRALDVLQQDVGALRNDTIAIRQDMATRQELAAIREEMRGVMAAMREEMRREIAAVREEMRSGMAAVREEAATRHTELLAAIRALAAGGAPPA